MRTKRMLQRAKAQDAGNVIAHAQASGWNDTLIHRHGNAAIRKALKAGTSGVAQPQVQYNDSTVQGLVDLVTKQLGRRPRRVAELRAVKPAVKGISFANAEKYSVRFLRNGEYSFGTMLVNPARPKAVGKGKTHDVLFVDFAGEGAQVETKTLSQPSLTRFLGGEITHQWLDGHSYVVTRVQDS